MQNTWKPLVALALIALIMVSGFSAVAVLAKEGRSGSGSSGRGETELEIEDGKLLVKPSVVMPTSTGEMYRPYFIGRFSGNGFIESGNDAEPISINVGKDNGRVFPLASAEALNDDAYAKIAKELEISTDEAKATAVVASTSTGVAQAAIAQDVSNKRRGDVWSGVLTIGFGDMQEEFFLIGKEKESSIRFAVIPMGEYPVDLINKLEIKKRTFSRIELWNGELNLKSDSDFKGEWKFTAFSYNQYYGYDYSSGVRAMPLEIATGSKAEVSDYIVEPVMIKKQKVFGFIPSGKQVAVVKIYKGDVMIAERTLAEDEVSEIDNLVLRVVKINGELKVVAETKS
ncbi:MAG: hypothetical protein QT01_C0002G0027 [archaeon GW2011_AR6]|nr:MAG: hypothetical protein QT01_C0002G0027 [archaeon GW2011_AR6]